MLLPGLDGIASTADELVHATSNGVTLDVEEVNRLIGDLRKQAEHLSAAIMTAPTTAYGARGDYIRLHSGKAHEHVRDALQDMVKGLDYYALAIERYRTAQFENDDDAAAALTRGARNLVDRGESCGGDGNFQGPSQCTTDGESR